MEVTFPEDPDGLLRDLRENPLRTHHFDDDAEAATFTSRLLEKGFTQLRGRVRPLNPGEFRTFQMNGSAVVSWRDRPDEEQAVEAADEGLLEAVGEPQPHPNEPPPAPAGTSAEAAELRSPQARGRKGGLARARNLSPERRKELARKAIQARWQRARDAGTHPDPSPAVPQPDPPTPASRRATKRPAPEPTAAAAVRFHVSVEIDAAELENWGKDQLLALFDGIAKVLSAQSEAKRR